MASENTDREEGVNFEALESALEDLDYPVSMDEFVEQYGDVTLERTSADPIEVRTLFEGTGEDTFESPEGVRQAVLNLMPRESVGRQRYSDRAGETPKEGQPESDDDMSF